MSLLTGIAIAGWLDLNLVIKAVEIGITHEIISKVVLGVSVVLILLALKCIFFNADTKNGNGQKDGILLENDNGKLLVSKNTIESLANAVVKNYESAQNVMTKVELDLENNVSIFITLFVYPDAIIKELSSIVIEYIKSFLRLKILHASIVELNNSCEDNSARIFWREAIIFSFTIIS